MDYEQQGGLLQLRTMNSPSTDILQVNQVSSSAWYG